MWACHSTRTTSWTQQRQTWTLMSVHSSRTLRNYGKLLTTMQPWPLRPVFDEIAAKYSSLIAPSATDEAPLGLGDMGSPVFNYVWTVRSFRTF
ncbi:amidase protein [Rutstroemia sp. NJR-2017a BBW]|nr:amidase protein [Rutstroemia sp. NJR-2017a BBW]